MRGVVGGDEVVVVGGHCRCVVVVVVIGDKRIRKVWRGPMEGLVLRLGLF